MACCAERGRSRSCITLLEATAAAAAFDRLALRTGCHKIDVDGASGSQTGGAFHKSGGCNIDATAVEKPSNGDESGGFGFFLGLPTLHWFRVPNCGWLGNKKKSNPPKTEIGDKRERGEISSCNHCSNAHTHSLITKCHQFCFPRFESIFGAV